MSLINPASANTFNAAPMSAFVWERAKSRCATPNGTASLPDEECDLLDDDIDANTRSQTRLATPMRIRLNRRIAMGVCGLSNERETYPPTSSDGRASGGQLADRNTTILYNTALGQKYVLERVG